jgi:hypothetical protein
MAVGLGFQWGCFRGDLGVFWGCSRLDLKNGRFVEGNFTQIAEDTDPEQRTHPMLDRKRRYAVADGFVTDALGRAGPLPDQPSASRTGGVAAGGIGGGGAGEVGHGVIC